MPNVGPTELIIALVILGLKRLPAAGCAAGQSMREFKTSLTGGTTTADEPQPVTAERA